MQMGFLTNCYQEQCTNEIWPKIHWPTLLPKRKATSEKLRFFWGRVYGWRFRVKWSWVLLFPNGLNHFPLWDPALLGAVHSDISCSCQFTFYIDILSPSDGIHAYLMCIGLFLGAFMSSCYLLLILAAKEEGNLRVVMATNILPKWPKYRLNKRKCRNM